MNTTYKKRRSILLSVIIAALLCLVGGLLLFPQKSVDAEEDGAVNYAATVTFDGNVTEWDSIKGAFTYANDLATTAEKSAEIKMFADATTTDTLNVEESKFITLDLNGYMLKYDNAVNNNSVIKVYGNFTLKDDGDKSTPHTITSPVTNEDVTVYGGLITGGTGSEFPSSVDVIIVGGGVLVDGGTFTMESGTIADNTAEQGGGVNVNGGGTFTMAGGYIRGNTANAGNGIGGGVCVAGGAEFTMTGGTISENTANEGGGVYVAYLGTFIMTGGTIGGGADDDGNSAQDGGGVGVANGGSFTMNGGVISHNSAVDGGGGVFVDGGGFTISDGTVSGNTAAFGGGVAMQGGTAKMTGGEISGNFALVGGCGMYIDDGTFKMSDGKISDNTFSPLGVDLAMSLGGGVVMQDGAFEMTGGEISGNTAHFGGGVIITEGAFIMENGSIRNNTGTYGAGGVLIMAGTFSLSGGSITSNAQTEDMGLGLCGGVCVGHEMMGGASVAFDVSGTPIITGNTAVVDGDTVENNILAGDGYVITVAGEFYKGAKIGVYNSGEIAVGFTQAENPSKYFISDNAAYNCIYVSDKATGTVTIGEHDYAAEFTVDKQPTCTKEGSKSKHCTHCDSTTEVTAIAALGHTLNYNPAVSPTNDQNGNIEFWDCEECGKFFADEDGNEEITDRLSVLIPKLIDPLTGGGISGTDILWITLIVVLSTTVLIEVGVIVYRAKRKFRTKEKK